MLTSTKIQLVKFKNEFKDLLAYLNTEFPDHQGFKDLTTQFDTASTVKPGLFRTMFKEYIYDKYAERIYRCDSTVMDSLHADDHDVLCMYSLWKSDRFTIEKKAQCFQHLINLCRITQAIGDARV